ncbi:MAG TPA: GntR family transcriptional regulator [Solirubrobacteraceae bacterium]|jgi:DNA-binding GntR family transcriptional regulator|nr:GntR family transcriptional regulator [Solirubrobacteraceae bacterium]
MESHLAVLTPAAGTSRGHRTLAEKAYDTLHTAIITGALRPGARLPIEELAEHLEMSPMPIREAVRRLDAVGLVENVPHRGARVKDLSVTDLAEVYEVRLSLETTAIRRAAERFSDEHLERARLSLGVLETMADDASVATSEAHARFHFALYEAAESVWLLRVIRPVWQVSERYALEWPQARRLAERASEHREMLAACEAHDPDRAATALRDHLATTANSLAAAMGSEPLYEVGAPA